MSNGSEEETWQLPGTTRDGESITKDWTFVGRQPIAGVRVQEMKSVPTGYGHLTEIWRQDWQLDDRPVDQVFQSVLGPGGLSAWHAHAHTTDRLFASSGDLRIVLYDARPDSETRGVVNELRFGERRPGLVVVPPKVYHGVQNVDAGPSVLLNVVDRAYDYVAPDHYRLEWDSPEIPYRFPR